MMPAPEQKALTPSSLHPPGQGVARRSPLDEPVHAPATGAPGLAEDGHGIGVTLAQAGQSQVVFGHLAQAGEAGPGFPLTGVRQLVYLLHPRLQVGGELGGHPISLRSAG
jgi:hypothetical protein